MTLVDLLRQFGEDPTVRMLAALVVLDFIMGVAAAVKTSTFRLSYIGDFLRNDVLGKLFPYYGLWLVLHVSGNDIDIGGFDAIEETVALVAAGAMAGSILNSLRELGLIPQRTPEEVAGSDPASPSPTPG